ncbi:MAG: MBL fold metallo-hydrolase [Candidatus Limnocylindria bacterium]
MRLTVLGRSPAVPNPGEACAGYIVEAGATRLLFDIGPGVVAQLLRTGTAGTLSAVVISHMHTDHVLDLVTLRHTFPWLHPPARKLDVVMPPGSSDQAADLARAAGDTAFFDKTFAIREHDGSGELRFDSLSVRPMPTQHYVPTWGFRVADGSGTLAYSADSGPCGELVALAEAADLFLCEATLRSAADDLVDARGHLTPNEAGAMAQEARAHRLVLTHLPVADRGAWACGEARAAFDGPTEVAEPLKAYEV